jgi:Leucine-rich repeat (LRR) protein
MTPLSPATLEAIQSKDYAAIMARLCDLERGPEQQYLYECYKKLRTLFEWDERIRESDSDLLYDFRTPEIKPSQRLLDFIRYATSMIGLEITEFSSLDDLLAISFLLPDMEILSFSSCTAVHLDRVLINFPLLTSIDLEFCPIVSPEDFVLPTLSLDNIRFCRNDLTQLPRGIENLRQLRSFSCVDNQLTEFPRELTTLPLLWDLDLHSNHISGALPESMGQLNNLQRLNLKDNQLKDIRHLGQLLTLSDLEIQGNPILVFPKRLSAIQRLIIDADQFKGLCLLFPDCKQLQSLAIMGGTSTVDLAHLQHNIQLDFLSIYRVGVSNLSLISKLHALTTLRLTQNRLDEDLAGIFSLTRLKILDLEDNDLLELPDRFAELPNLETIHLGGNRIKEMPPSLLRSKLRRL